MWSRSSRMWRRWIRRARLEWCVIDDDRPRLYEIYHRDACIRLCVEILCWISQVPLVQELLVSAWGRGNCDGVIASGGHEKLSLL